MSTARLIRRQLSCLPRAHNPASWQRQDSPSTQHRSNHACRSNRDCSRPNHGSALHSRATPILLVAGHGDGSLDAQASPHLCDRRRQLNTPRSILAVLAGATRNTLSANGLLPRGTTRPHFGREYNIHDQLLISRATGQMAYQNFKCPVSALIVQVRRRFASITSSNTVPGWLPYRRQSGS